MRLCGLHHICCHWLGLNGTPSNPPWKQRQKMSGSFDSAGTHILREDGQSLEHLPMHGHVAAPACLSWKVPEHLQCACRLWQSFTQWATERMMCTFTVLRCST